MSDIFLPEKLVNQAVDKLVPYEKNARVHPEAQIQQIMASISRNGFLVPVLIDEKKMILAGHGRVEAAKRLGLKKVPCISSKHLSDAQKRAFIIADNKIADNAEWDEEILALELSDLGAMDFDLSEIGFDDKELETLLSPAPEKKKQKKKKAKKRRSSKIDVWLLGELKVVCVDLSIQEHIDLLFEEDSGKSVFVEKDGADQIITHWQDKTGGQAVHADTGKPFGTKNS